MLWTIERSECYNSLIKIIIVENLYMCTNTYIHQLKYTYIVINRLIIPSSISFVETMIYIFFINSIFHSIKNKYLRTILVPSLVTRFGTIDLLIHTLILIRFADATLSSIFKY